ncbi:hypothetical protein F5B22DRAFT_266914 [Xylaria bambusicola]|uniref:uncharacterized protein n=1 Tax=Xylaria bambusicola TaxID=326684 RepID=UPI002007509E|nr:uncharacterized protein F5B22DRAFT_266914 [Xylaria bambusicola]KAI0526057.1 hypothetical protein F5B22DRAFT_266914 [Xylaria bambusicola]
MTPTTQLSQLVSQVPGFINEHSKRRRDTPTLDLSQFFDFSAFYDGNEPSSPGTRSRSVASSDPGLTSGPSEEDGAPSPGPSFEPYHKEAIKQIKQQDDRFTVPEREIRPKGGLPYPSKIHLDSVPSPTGSSPSGSNVVILSNPGSPTMFLDAAVEENHALNRGRRNKPLNNPEKVAVMRKLGACYRCKTRKVPCDEGAPCTNCTKDAGKMQHAECEDLAEQICFRQHPTTAFSEINRVTCAEMPPRGKTSGPMLYFQVFFDMRKSVSPLMIPVSRVEYETFDGRLGMRNTKYQLNFNNFSLEENMLVDWASAQMQLEEDTFQSALDHLVMACMGNGQADILPHSDLLQKVHKLRCLYKIWRHSSFVYQTTAGNEYGRLPDEIHRVLKGIAAKLIKGIENDVLSELSGRRPKQADRLPLWACTMQVVLLYHDLISITSSQEPWVHTDLPRRAESLMNYAVVMCDLHFGKKKPTLASDYAHLTTCFANVEFQQIKFFADIHQRRRLSDKVLIALLAKYQKCSRPRGMPPPQKRLRKMA